MKYWKLHETNWYSDTETWLPHVTGFQQTRFWHIPGIRNQTPRSRSQLHTNDLLVQLATTIHPTTQSTGQDSRYKTKNLRLPTVFTKRKHTGLAPDRAGETFPMFYFTDVTSAFVVRRKTVLLKDETLVLTQLYSHRVCTGHHRWDRSFSSSIQSWTSVQNNLINFWQHCQEETPTKQPVFSGMTQRH